MKYIKKILVAIVYLFILIPLIYTFLVSFTNSDTFELSGFSLRWFKAAFESNSFMTALKNSLLISFIATLLSLIIGFLAAYGIFKNSKLKKMQIFFDTPLIIPHIVLSFLLFQILVVSLRIDSLWALVLAHITVMLPYIVRYLTVVLLKFDKNIYLAARTLGMGEIKTIFKVILPCINNSIVAVGLISFINSFNNLSISYFLVSPGIQLLPSQMLSYLEYFYEPIIASLSVILIAFTTVIIIFIEKALKFSLIEKE